VRVTAVLDQHTEKILQQLAQSRRGNRDLVAREALAILAAAPTYSNKSAKPANKSVFNSARSKARLF
jgi:predicted transcriptional regulator